MSDSRKRKSISTKRGDEGDTSLFDGSRVSKGSLRPEAYGTLDEMAAFLGLARAKSEIPLIHDSLLKVQNLVYLVNSELACPVESKEKLHKRFEKRHLEWLEKTAGEIEKNLDLPPRFVLYGETEVGALLDVARAVARRAERTLTRVTDNEPLENPFIKPFINRLSDFLYLLARMDEKEAGLPFRHPEE